MIKKGDTVLTTRRSMFDDVRFGWCFECTNFFYITTSYSNSMGWVCEDCGGQLTRCTNFLEGTPAIVIDKRSDPDYPNDGTFLCLSAGGFILLGSDEYRELKEGELT